jgi:tRNA pseudouridine55 synthase
MNGILNIDKPAGWTSHDVVAWVRRVLREKRVGHAGTLDPMATGVLLVCVGQATRVVEYLTAGQKVYRAEAQLGVTTDTFDADGQVTATAVVPPLTADDLRGALAGFAGEIEQRPPAFSAIKQDGEAAYRKARRGEAVDLPVRLVMIHGIELLDWDPIAAKCNFEVRCGPGTYIRSLTYDLGQALSCGATLTRLTRTRSSQFVIEDAVDLDTLAAAARSGDLAPYLHPIETALQKLTRVPVDAEQVTRLTRGQFIPCTSPPEVETGYALDANRAVIAILAYDAPREAWRPIKVFEANDPRRGTTSDP